MLQCKKCNQSLDNSWFFCPQCGERANTFEYKFDFSMESQSKSQSQSQLQSSSQPPSPSQQESKDERTRSASSPEVNRGAYGSGVRAQVLDLIVRQALAGANWRELFASPLRVNCIAPEEIEAEVNRRRGQRPS